MKKWWIILVVVIVLIGIVFGGLLLFQTKGPQVCNQIMPGCPEGSILVSRNCGGCPIYACSNTTCDPYYTCPDGSQIPYSVAHEIKDCYGKVFGVICSSATFNPTIDCAAESAFKKRDISICGQVSVYKDDSINIPFDQLNCIDEYAYFTKNLSICDNMKTVLNNLNISINSVSYGENDETTLNTLKEDCNGQYNDFINRSYYSPS